MVTKKEHEKNKENKKNENTHNLKNKKHKVQHKNNKIVKKSEKTEINNNDKILLTTIFVILSIAILCATFYIGMLVGANHPTIKGNKLGSGTATITEYGDFQCPYCKRFYQNTLGQIRETYGNKIKFEYKQFPLGFHQYAEKAAEASECARDQGKFWEYHDKLFSGSNLTVDTLKQYAKDLGLDTNKFNSCLDNGEKVSKIKADQQEAVSKGVKGTPSFWINGELVVGAQPFATFKQKIDAMLNGESPKPAQAAPEQAPKPKEVPKTDKPKVELFVMAYCPYGLQMEKAYIPAVALLGDKIDADVKFVYYAMHGKKEIDENTIQYCIQKEDNKDYLKYLKCFVETANSTTCISSTGINKAIIDKCVADTDKEFGITADFNAKDTWLSGRFPKYPVYDALNKKYGVRGSPTLIINGVQASANRTPDAVKEAICNAFTTKPKECDTKLSTDNTAPGVGAIDAKGLPNAVAAGCGA